VGYKDTKNLYIGWFSARADTVVNYIPARITGLLTVISAKVFRLDWSNCVKVLTRDHRRTDSLNAGWSMSAMAGALGIALEKPELYTLGNSYRALEPDDIKRALRIMKLNTLLFVLLVTSPIMAIGRTIIPLG
jgi:adenosylcobinamide-phosphate synthase